jgi:predicted negative regulator of RcsB-dependent stress response
VTVLNLPNPMSQLPPADQSSPHADPSAVPAAEPGFEVTVHAFWNKNRSFILLLCGVVLLAIVGREGWQYFAAMREQSLQQEYSQISDKPEKLGAFAEANSGHPLAGVAYLQVADRKFEAAAYKEAATFYTKAAGSLKNEALLGRAKLGSAISLVNGGDNAGGEAALKALSADQTLPKAARAEATYHLASLASEAGKTDEVKKLVEDITKIDLGGPWSQRATMLLANLPVGNKSADTAAAITFKPEGK